MKGLSALSKFLGMYGEFGQLVKDYDLKWKGKSNDELMIDRLNKITDPDDIFNWVKQVKINIPKLTEFADLMAISGLRFIESINSYNLIIQQAESDKPNAYYNVEKATLEHFQYREIFLRHTKKAFVSFVPPELVAKISAKTERLDADIVQKMVSRSGLRCRFSDVRENHGTFLTKYLREPEINFLHGRVSTGVFMANYFNPALLGDLKSRAFQGIAEVQEKIKLA